MVKINILVLIFKGKQMKKTLLLVSVLCSLTTIAKATPTFNFTAIPDQNSAGLEKRFGGIAKYLSQQLNVKVKYIPVKSYTASITAFKSNVVQLAWFGGLSGVKARLAVAGSKAIAQGAEDRKFKTYIIAHVSTGLAKSETFPKGIQDKTFTFGSKGSTSGRLMPEYYIRKAFNDSPNHIFKRVGFSGDHSKTISLVESGTYLVGAVNYAVWDRSISEHKIDTSKVQIIWTTPEYPDYNWTIRGDVDKTWGKGFTQKLTQALLNLKDKKLLASFPRSAFIPAKNADYKPILDTAKALGIVR